MKKIIGALCFILTTSVQAAPVTWTLNDVGFDDGEILEGSFTFDADTNSYSNVYIYSSDYSYAGYSDTALPPFVIWNSIYSSSNENYLGGETAYDFVGLFILDLRFDSALTNAGGSVSLLPTSYEGLYQGEFVAFERAVVSGTLSAVPIPAPAWLFGSALAGLGWMRRKQTI